MSKTTIRERVFLVITILYITYLIFPLFTDYFSIPLGILNLVTFSLLVFLFPSAFFSRTSLWVALYLLVLIVYSYLGKSLPSLGIGNYSSFRIVLIEAAGVLPAIAIANILAFLNKPRIIQTITVVSLLLFIISFLFVIPLAASEPDLLRSSDVRGEYHVFGTPSYTLTNAYMLILPAMLYGVRKTKKLLLIVLLLAIVLLCAVIYLSYVSTAIILSFICFLFFLIYREDNNKNLFAAILFSLLFLFLYVSGILELFMNSMSDLFHGTATQRKIEDISNILFDTNSGGGSLNKRQNLHRISWNAFSNHMLFGSLPVGDHSSLLDRLGGLGLLGFIPFLSILISQFKCVFHTLRYKGSRFFYIISVVMTFVYLFEKGLFGAEGWLFYSVLIPVYFQFFESFVSKR